MTTDRQVTYFLHGLESTGNGTKGKFFGNHFPDILRPDFEGSLSARLSQLESLCREAKDITLIGSSFGGLMASCFADSNRERVSRLVLMAPALNFGNYTPPIRPIEIPTLLVIGEHDDVTPIDPVVDLAQATYSNLTIWVSDDDHMLHNSFTQLDWKNLLDTGIDFSSLQPPPGVLKSDLGK